MGDEYFLNIPGRMPGYPQLSDQPVTAAGIRKKALSFFLKKKYTPYKPYRETKYLNIKQF